MSIFTPSLRATYRSFRDFQARRSASRALSAMDDVFLKDIGVSRSEIHAVVQGTRSHGA